MQTINNRVTASKQQISIDPKSLESNKIKSDINLFLKSGGKITQCSSKLRNFKSEIEKLAINRIKRKAKL